MDQTAINTPISGHSIGKLKRQRAILDAAREIILTMGDAGLNMRAMAAKAGVSPATPYNLFGSKQAVLQAIYDEDLLSFYQMFEERASARPLDRLFDMIDLSVEHWQRSPDFYKALLATLYRNSGWEAGGEAWSPRLEQVRTLIDDAVAAGDLGSDAPVEILTATVARIFRSIAQEWIDGTLSLAEARKDLGQSFGLVLAGLVTPLAREALAAIGRRYDATAPESGEVA